MEEGNDARMPPNFHNASPLHEVCERAVMPSRSPGCPVVGTSQNRRRTRRLHGVPLVRTVFRKDGYRVNNQETHVLGMRGFCLKVTDLA